MTMQLEHEVDEEAQRDDRESAPEWRAIDRRLRAYARQRSTLDAAESFDLVRAERMRIYIFHGCVTLYEYMERVLGYSPHTARERMRVARALVELPLTTAGMARGDLTFSAVRELTRVATADTEAEWLTAAGGRSGREIEMLVAGHARGDLPEDPTHPDLRTRTVRIELPTDVFALLRQARAVLADERGGEVGDADLVATMCRRILDPGTGEGGPAHQIAFTQCSDCKRATQNGAGRELDVRPDVSERAACDARVIGSLDAATPARATTTVTPRMREQIFARDHHRCRVPGCRSARNLDIHHIIEQAHGGPHAMWNLLLTCSGHHAAVHAGLLSISGRVDDGLAFAWTNCPAVPPDLDEAERVAAIEARREAIFDRPDDGPIPRTPAEEALDLERINRRGARRRPDKEDWFVRWRRRNPRGPTRDSHGAGHAITDEPHRPG